MITAEIIIVTSASASLILFFAAVNIVTWSISVVVNVGITTACAFIVKKVKINQHLDVGPLRYM